jgi:hypothetical protein
MRVLLAHDDPRSCIPLADALGRNYIVRIACSVADMRESVLTSRATCVVCIPSKKLRAREVHEEALHMGIPPERVIFVDPEDLSRPEAVAMTVTTLARFDAPRDFSPET